MDKEELGNKVKVKNTQVHLERKSNPRDVDYGKHTLHSSLESQWVPNNPFLAPLFFTSVQGFFIPPQLTVGVVHGDLRRDEYAFRLIG